MINKALHIERIAASALASLLLDVSSSTYSIVRNLYFISSLSLEQEETYIFYC